MQVVMTSLLFLFDVIGTCIYAGAELGVNKSLKIISIIKLHVDDLPTDVQANYSAHPRSIILKVKSSIPAVLRVSH